MEKIYMENNNDNKKGFYFKDFFRRNGIVITSVLIIVVAIAAFITSGFSQTSYAIPDVEVALPETFTTAAVETNIYSDTQFMVSAFFANTTPKTQVFCLERSVPFSEGKSYVKGDAIKDYGLLHLMAALNSDSFGQGWNENLKTWVSQVSIWLYLYTAEAIDSGKIAVTNVNASNFASIVQQAIDNGAVPNSSANFINQVDITKMITAKGVYVELGHTYTVAGDVGTQIPSGTKTLFESHIASLLVNAIANRNSPNKVLRANTKTSEISLTNDGKYYQSSEVVVVGSPSDNFNGYEVKFAAKPEGTILVDSNGEEIKDLTNFKASDKFWVRVPVDSVKEDNKVIKLSITGSFKTYEGNYYIGANGQTAQKITTVKTVNNNVNTGLEIELNYTPDVPDTGMSTAQTVYFVGLIVLLSGLGIIYANVKPRESN